MSDVQTPTPPDPAHVLQQRVVAMLAGALLFSGRSAKVPHSVLLDALLSAYLAELEMHPCCQTHAASGLRAIAARLEAQHAEAAATAEQALAAMRRGP